MLYEFPLAKPKPPEMPRIIMIETSMSYGLLRNTIVMFNVANNGHISEKKLEEEISKSGHSAKVWSTPFM